MNRIDLSETIKRITFPEKVLEWLDLFGDVAGVTQKEAFYQDEIFIASTPFEKLLLYSINKDLSTLNAIYILLRCEFIHQATSHVRLFCESFISLKYISIDPEARSKLFWGYSDIEAYEIASSINKWDRDKARPENIERMDSFINSISEKYRKAKGIYTFTDRKGRKRPFSNWCNKSIARQARECGPEFSRLYELVYKQMSSYIHGSSWSLRRQMSYSRIHYQPDIVLNDIASIIRTALVVWVEWAKFCVHNLNWRLSESVIDLPERIDALDSKHFPVES